MKNMPLLKESCHLHDPRLKVALYAIDPLADSDCSVAFSYGVVQSPFGEFFVASCQHGIIELQFTGGESTRIIDEFRRKMHCQWISRDDSIAGVITRKILDSCREDELEVGVCGTPFQLEVWSALLDVPFGETVTYAELADRIGKPDAVRAVASAIARNNVAYLIPCHRVVRSDGSLGGYRWNTVRKDKMIAWEKNKLSERAMVL